VHGWSTWPVFLLPKYLAGLEPLEPGWVKWSVHPVLAGLNSVDVQLHTPAGNIAVSLTVEEAQGTGQITIDVPQGTTGEIYPPLGWHISECPVKCERVPGEHKVLVRKGGKVAIKIDKTNTSASSSSMERFQVQTMRREPQRCSKMLKYLAQAQGERALSSGNI